MMRRLRTALLAGMLALMLSGCMIVSGDRSSSDALEMSGNLTRSFLSAEGSEELTLATGLPNADLTVIVLIELGQGDLRLDLFNPDGAAMLVAQGQPAEQRTWTATLRTDAQGNLRYRVTARGAREVEYQLLYRAER